jgi:hypothetical protein
MRVLIVEDEPYMAEAVRDGLRLEAIAADIADRALLVNPTPTPGVFPIRSNLLHAFAPRAAAVLAFLLVFGLVGGWLLAAARAAGGLRATVQLLAAPPRTGR